MIKDDEPEYGQPDPEPGIAEPGPGPGPVPGCAKMEQLEPVLLPRRALVPGQFGPGSIKGGKILRLNRDNERKVLESCSVSANLSQACRRSGVSYERVNKVMRANPGFAAQVREHLDFAIDRLEQASLRRAIVGHKRVHEVLDREGNPVELTVHDPPSDRLAIKLLESRRPEVYGRRVAEVGSTHVTNIALVPRADLDRIAAQATTRTIEVESAHAILPNSTDKSNT